MNSKICILRLIISSSENLENNIGAAEPESWVDPTQEPAGQGEDQINSAQDYLYQNNIPAESKPFVEDEEKPSKKDTGSQKKSEAKPIGSATDEPKKKKGFFKRLFGKKDKD